MGLGSDWEDTMFDAAHDLVNQAEDLGPSDEMAVLARVLSLKGLDAVDVGCGSGRIARRMAALGANVLGVEPDPVQAERNRQAEPVAGLRFVEAPGQALPLDDRSVDLVVFSFSLHHVPATHMAAALAEARRVLRPTGFLCVFEPLLSGSLEAVYRPFHDERAVRRLAYDALRDHVAPHFGEARELMWSEQTRYEDFEAFVADHLSATHNQFTRGQIDTPEVRRRFDAGRSNDGFVFSSYARANIFRTPLGC